MSNHSSSFPFSVERSSNSVYSRLYNDSSARQRNLDIMAQVSIPKQRLISPRKTEMKVEDLLIQKYQGYKAKLNQKMIKAKSDELKEMRASPEISNYSRQLAKQNESKESRPKLSASKSIQEIILNSRCFRKQPIQEVIKISEKPGPKMTEISLKDLEEEVVVSESVLKSTRSLTLPQFRFASKEKLVKSPKTLLKSSYVSSAKKIQAKEEVKILQEGFGKTGVSVEELKKIADSRKNPQEEEQNIEPLLSMSVLERSEYWLKKRAQKASKRKQEDYEKSFEECTFRPQFSPRREDFFVRNSSLGKIRSYSPNQSYLIKHFSKKQFESSSSFRPSRVPSGANTKNNSNVDNSRSHSLILSPRILSPIERNIRYKAGLDFENFLSKAQIMVDYKSLGAK